VGSAALAAGLAAGLVLGLSACNTNPHSPDVSAPTSTESTTGAEAGAAPPQAHHPRPTGIQLPNTLTLAFDRTPTFQDLPHHVVLWNASQALKAELAASYQGKSAATPDLRRYWTGAGYTEAYNWAQSWIDTKTRPVGRVVVSDVTVDSLTPVQASVSYCRDMTAVIRGDALTHTGGKALQPPHTNGQHVLVTLVPTGSKGQWQVSNEVVAMDSPLCPWNPHHRNKTGH
jgi:hypothetical protein